MPKDETTEKATKGQGGKDSNAAAEPDKKSHGDDDQASDSDSAVDLKPVRPKIGESKDNLRKRSEWFQKRHGGS